MARWTVGRCRFTAIPRWWAAADTRVWNHACDRLKLFAWRASGTQKTNVRAASLFGGTLSEFPALQHYIDLTGTALVLLAALTCEADVVRLKCEPAWTFSRDNDCA